jgi:hypothetical protein
MNPQSVAPVARTLKYRLRIQSLGMAKETRGRNFSPGLISLGVKIFNPVVCSVSAP